MAITHFISKWATVAAVSISFIWYSGRNLLERNPENATLVALAMVVSLFIALFWHSET